MVIVFIITITTTAMTTTIAIATIITSAITNIHQGQSIEILLYGIDTWREAAL